MNKDYHYTKIDIDKIKPYGNNARVHNSKQVNQIMESIKQFGFTNPLLIDNENNLIAGHGRLEAVKQLNRIDFKDNPLKELPAIVITGLSDADKKALIIADNKIAENASWDYEALALELKELESVNYDISNIGFSEEEFAEIFEGLMLGSELEDELGEKKESPIALFPNEHVDYLVFLFDKDYDFTRAVEFFGVTKANGSMSPKIKKIGIGRGLKGDALIKLIDKITINENT